jgi:hypothetical protein
LYTYYFTYALTWQQAANAFMLQINMCGLPMVFNGLFNGDPCLNLQGAQATPLTDGLAKIGAAIFDRINDLTVDDLKEKVDSRFSALFSAFSDLSETEIFADILKALEGTAAEDFVKCLEEGGDLEECIEEVLADDFTVEFTANFGYAVGSASFTLVPYNPCRTSGHARQQICTVQHCLDRYNRNLRASSKRRKGKKKTPSSGYGY